ncbi:ArgE/DapE family deacylase [Siminovitchia fordii]|uniref:Acetylornithine deacetylase n=1 Tax=Siminovitchia fordii TaxID=254759 RepID=A0ABQ4K733_9BACI|nr:ArgE/DapE family deacylase [Siminovitchia fordii]GIN21548.1 acetylornithine deacetylase [Siminovitchia fordii]
MTANTKKKVQNYIEEHKDELVKAIVKAVQIPSVIGDENAMANYMKKKYEEIGLKVVEVYPEYEKIQNHPAFSSSGLPFEGRKNIIGIWEGKEEAPSLTLNGHIDVVSPEPVENWTKDPWGGEIEGNKLYGRGSGDMKAGLMANWFALKALLDLGIKPKGKVMLQSVIEEEAGGAGGTLSCLEDGYVTDGFIATEPHALRLTVAHAGVMYFRVRVLGKTAHAGMAHLGVNAISKMYKVYNELEELAEKRAKGVYFELFHKGSGQSVHMNLGTLKGGDWASNVPGEAVLECRVGFIPSETRAEIKELIERTVQEAAKGDEWLEEHPPEVEWYGWTTEAWNQDPEDPYVKAFKKTAEDVLGREVEIAGRAAGNDARFTQYYDKPGLVFGPRCSNMHGPDEYVEIDSVIDTAKVFAAHIIDWCGVEED